MNPDSDCEDGFSPVMIQRSYRQAEIDLISTDGLPSLQEMQVYEDNFYSKCQLDENGDRTDKPRVRDESEFKNDFIFGRLKRMTKDQRDKVRGAK